jgi:plastocyanin
MKLLLRILTVGVMLATAAWATVWPLSITEFAFTPPTVNVVQGDTVIWTNNGSFRHSSTSGTGGIPDGIWDSGLLSPDASFSQPFPNVGSFPYFCSIHYLSMTGTVVVGPPTGFEEGRQVLVPSSLVLAVRPNPFRSVANIRYRPLSSSPVSLAILDLGGRVVRTLEPGPWSARWDGTDNGGRQVEAGVYIVRLSQGVNENYARLVKPE